MTQSSVKIPSQTTEELYDLVGECNINIVKTEQEVYQLEEQLKRPLFEEPDFMNDIRRSLREKRVLIHDLNTTIIRTRRTIWARLELDINQMEQQLTIQPLGIQSEHTRHSIDTLRKEVQRLKKLTDAQD
jgi:chemotaxis protein histidine kinase CheA